MGSVSQTRALLPRPANYDPAPPPAPALRLSTSDATTSSIPRRPQSCSTLRRSKSPSPRPPPRQAPLPTANKSPYPPRGDSGAPSPRKASTILRRRPLDYADLSPSPCSRSSTPVHTGTREGRETKRGRESGILQYAYSRVSRQSKVSGGREQLEAREGGREET